MTDKPAKPSRFFGALGKTRKSISDKLSGLFSGSSGFDQAKLDELHDTLILSDIGIQASQSIIDAVSSASKRTGPSDQQVFELVQSELQRILARAELENGLDQHPRPVVVMMVGVNGVGKTTTCAKIARYYQKLGHSIMFAACDTYRPAAIEQLLTWGERLEVPVIAQDTGADPAAVAHDALHAAISRNCSIILVDTAGRQQSRDDLMRQLGKIRRVMAKIDPSAPHETLITIDAGTGQNAMSQVEQFNQHSPLSGLCVTKLDGTAKGGIVVALTQQFALPIRFVGLGEGIDDIATFRADDYVRSMLSLD